MDNSDVIERTAPELIEPYRSDIARSLASKVHAALVLDQAGRHTTGKLRVPENRGLRLAGYGINGGLRGMSDLETPEADMMRDHSSVDAAPATLRAEESQPGLDPDNPGAAPDIMLGHQRLAGLGRPVSDPVWDDAERVFADCCRLMGRLREQTARGLSLIATLYLRERHRWADFLAERGVVVPRYGPRPSSQFHAVCRHFLRVGAGGDRTGYAGKLAAVLDEWHRATETISPEQLPAWIEACGGIEHIYQASRFAATAPSQSGVRNAPAAADVYEDDNSNQKQGLWNGGPGTPLSPATVNSQRQPEPRYYAIDEDETTQHWYTPPYIFDALECEFDLDPASPGRSVVPWIPARQHYTSGGLERPWRGFVWLNPPYGRHILMPWLEKFVQHGNGIALVPERTSTGWWQEAASRSDLLLFVKQRIPFISSTRDDTTACAIGSTLIAIGERGTRGLITASRNELGLLLKPYKGQ